MDITHTALPTGERMANVDLWVMAMITAILQLPLFMALFITRNIETFEMANYFNPL